MPPLTQAQLEHMAGSINSLAGAVTRLGETFSERAVLALLYEQTNGKYSKTTIRDVLRAVTQLPDTMLTTHARAIRLRD